MDATKGNGLDAANIQPAKTLTKYAADFIAWSGIFASRLDVVTVLLILQFVAIVAGVLS